MSQRLYLHIGVPKSGSTFLQSTLGTHRTLLKELGHVYPFVKPEGMFHAAVEMAGKPTVWGLEPEQIDGTFARLLRRGRRLGGAVVISHEIFGSATPEQVAVIADQVADFETHVVITARDLCRTATAQWQEEVKNRRAGSFAEFAEQLVAEIPDDPAADHDYWRSQNLARLVDQWQAVAPPERLHLVTCPPAGADPALLWRRFCDAIDLDPDRIDVDSVPSRNASLGTPQIALLREVIAELDDRIEQPWHSLVVKRWFAQSLLSEVPGPKPVTPDDVAGRLDDVARAWAQHVVDAGVVVHGDLADLVAPSTAAGAPHPDAVSEADMLRGLPEVLARMLERERDRRIEIADLRSEVTALTGERDTLTAQRADLAARLDEVEAQRDDLVRRRDRWRPRVWAGRARRRWRA